jgi:spermidine synthase
MIGPSLFFSCEDQMSSLPTRQRFLPWLLLLFFGSGFAALIYEIVWLQLLELIIGSSGVSLGVLLGAFMGGMCLGSLLLPRMISCSYHPLRIYAFLEIAIGLFGILVLYGTPYVADFCTSLLGPGIFSRALIAAVCLVIPASLMGATLPVVARFVEATPEGISWMGFFYGGNIAGSVFGCLLAGFYLLRLHDMPTATYAAVALNFAVALVALALARKTATAAPPDTLLPEIETQSPYRGLVYLTIALSGLSALGAEVVWTRLLSLLLGGTVYSFSIILAVFLIGLGIGSGAGSILARTVSSPRFALAFCQMAVAVAVSWAAFVISKSLPYWPVNPGMYTNDWGPWHIFQLDFLRTAWMVLPASLLWGASFPLAIAAIAIRGRDPGRLVGAVYAANTLGAILGSLGFSLYVIPFFGTQGAERSLIVIAVSSAIVALFSCVFAKSRNNTENGRVLRITFSHLVYTVLALMISVFLVQTVSAIPWMLVAWGRYSAAYMAHAEPEIIKEGQKLLKNGSPSQWYCTYMGEGMNVSVAVTQTAAGVRFFHGAGKVQASSQPQDMRLQRMLGHLSALTCKNPDRIKDVLVVACGAGVTAGSFVPYPSVKHIVICDIEPLVPKIIAPMFSKENYGIVNGIDKSNPHFVQGKEVSVIYDDGRHYIRTLPKDARFDVITSDPIDPWVKGSAALNTIEYYEMCKRHLKPGGVMSLWMPLYESNLSSAKSLIATFFQVFPNGLIFSNDAQLEGYDAVLLGQAEPSAINVDSVQQLLGHEDYAQVRSSLSEVGFGSPNDWIGSPDQGITASLLATFAGRASSLSDWTQNAQINRDSSLRLQYLAGMYFNSYLSTNILQSILSHYKFPQDLFVGSGRNIENLKEALRYQGRWEK